MFPFWVGLIVAICGLTYFQETLRSKSSEKFLLIDTGQFIIYLYTALSIVGYVAIMPYLGFTLSTFLFIMFHIHNIGGYRLVFSLIFSFCSTVVIGYCFRVLLYLALPKGFVGW